MKKQLLFILLFPAFLNAQTIWEETFDSYSDYTGIKGANSYVESGGYTTSAVTKWQLDASDLELTSSTADYFYIDIAELHARDLDGSAYFTTENIDISTQTGDVTIKIDKIEFEAYSSGDFDGSEYVDVYYSTDNGATYTIIPYQAGTETNAGHSFANDGDVGVDFTTSLDFSFDPGAATTVMVKIRMYTDGANERFEIDDISITRNTVVVWEENFDSYPADYGYVGIDKLAPAQLNSGDYPASVTKWTLTPSVSFVNQNDYAATLNGSFRFNDVDNAVTFETENIDVTGVSEITFSTDVKFGVGFEGDEYLDIYYSTDGGSTYILETTSTHTYQAGVNITEANAINFSKTLSGISATNFRLKIIAFSDSNVEDFVLDNIKVVNTATASVDNVFASSLKFYPNPISNTKVLNIESAESGVKNITIYNVLGETILSKTIPNKEKSIELSKVNSGIYFVRVIQNKKTATKKIILK
jgi:hypothetical protein